MNPNEYQSLSLTTALPNALKLEYLIAGLGGEAGEVEEAILDYEWSEDNDRSSINSECADMLWFLALIAHHFNWNFSDIVLEDNHDTLDELDDLIEISLRVEGADSPTLERELSMYTGKLQTLCAKAVRDDEGLFTEERLRKMKLALSNVVFSVGRLAKINGATLEELMVQNINKLTDRKARGVLGGDGNKR